MKNWIIGRTVLMAAEGGAGGGGEPPTQTQSAAATHADPPPPPPQSAAATHADPPPPQTQSAAATHADPPPTQSADVDLAKMSDEDWAAAVMPDPEKDGEPKPDRTLLAPMAKELREAGVQPGLMQKIVGAYTKSIDQLIQKQDAERASRMAELNRKCEEAVTKEEWTNFAAAYNEHIAGDPELKRVVDTTEIGSNPTFIKLCALAGATIRVDRPPAATATAGSSQNDLDRRVFEATVPKHLR